VNNAEKILSALDAKLNLAVELTLYGRAALALGFVDAPPELFNSKDADVVLWHRQAEELEETNFWEAINELNEEFHDEGRYISRYLRRSR